MLFVISIYRVAKTAAVFMQIMGIMGESFIFVF